MKFKGRFVNMATQFYDVFLKLFNTACKNWHRLVQSRNVCFYNFSACFWERKGSENSLLGKQTYEESKTQTLLNLHLVHLFVVEVTTIWKGRQMVIIESPGKVIQNNC